MALFGNLKIGVKIIAGYVIALVLTAVVGGVAIFQLTEVAAKVENLTQNLSEDKDIASDVEAQILIARLHANRYLRTENPEELRRFLDEFDTLLSVLERADTAITKAERVEMLATIHTTASEYKTAFDEIAALVAARIELRTTVLDPQAQLAQDNLNALGASALQADDSAVAYYAGLAQQGVQRMRVNMLKYSEAGDAEWVARFQDREAEARAALEELESLVETRSDRDALAAAAAAIDAYSAGFDEVQAQLSRQLELETVVDELGPQIRVTATAMLDSVTTDFDAENQAVKDLMTQTVAVEIVTMVAAVLLGLGLGYVISRGITQPLQALTRAAAQIADVDMQSLSTEISALSEGDLTRRVAITAQPVPVTGRDETGQMAQAFNAMIERLQQVGQAFDTMSARLRDAVGQVADSATSVSAAAGQLASAAGQAGQATAQISTTIQQVARGTQQQSEGVTKTAASVEQMRRAIDGVARGAQEQANSVGKASQLTSQITAAIGQVAGNAEAVTKESLTAAEAARAGSRTVEETIKGMSTIRSKVGVSAGKVREMGQRSDQIGAIVETIDDIASQTNLLALNAAIEAARAGEHGKGFAVVADEVRKLAERASAATKEIGGLIKSIQATVGEAVRAMDEGAREVESGSELANEAGEALAGILKAAEAVSGQAEAALNSTRAMSGLSNELVGAMDSVSAVVEENTAATEEMAAGSSDVSQAIENIASVSEENSAAVEQVSASTEEMSAQVEEVNASAQSLSEMAHALQSIVARFKLAESERTAAFSSAPAARAVPVPAVARKNGHTNGHHYQDLPMGK